MKIPILYEDKDIAIINKPAGLMVHPDGKSKPARPNDSGHSGGEKTLVDWVLQKFPATKKVGEPITLTDGTVIIRPGIVHRLDKETSGVMIVAKTKAGFEFYKDKFQNREMKKVYHAFVWGEVKEDDGKINRPIGRSSTDFRLYSAQRGARGEIREALTEYNVLFRGKGYSFVSAMPRTGRTHQIRVHFKAVNHPIIGDALYAPKYRKALGFKRVALHSYAINFIDRQGKEITVKAPDPEDFKIAAKKIGLIK
ncbi:MAG: RluA family pseudouridine synthase [Minisyncoccia bacterium]